MGVGGGGPPADNRPVVQPGLPLRPLAPSPGIPLPYALSCSLPAPSCKVSSSCPSSPRGSAGSPITLSSPGELASPTEAVGTCLAGRLGKFAHQAFRALGDAEMKDVGGEQSTAFTGSIFLIEENEVISKSSVMRWKMCSMGPHLRILPRSSSGLRQRLCGEHSTSLPQVRALTGTRLSLSGPDWLLVPGPREGPPDRLQSWAPPCDVESSSSALSNWNKTTQVVWL